MAKLLEERKYLAYLKLVGWNLKKGGFDFSLFDENDKYLCTIKVLHSKNKKREVSASSIRKTEKEFKRKGLVMATAKEIKEQLAIALKEIGNIKPWFDKEVNEWIFSHPNYPVEYGGESSEEVVKNYPKYLREFIKHRLDDTLNSLTERKTKGHGGRRQGAGRPKGSVKEEKERIALPKDITFWFKTNPNAIDLARKTMRKYI